MKNESQISYISKTLNPQLKLYTMQHFFPKTSFSSSSSFSSPLYSLISRHYSSFPKLPKLRGIPYKQRAKTINQAQQALIDYLYATRSLSFNHAENISKNSLFSLSDLITKIDFTPSTFPRDFKRFLSYHPINEFEFFFESIGIPHSEINGYLPANEFFLSEEGAVLNAARALLTFGFPWNKLGILYKEEISIFSKDSETLNSRIFEFKSLGFDTVSVVGICLAFPYVLRGDDDELSDEVDSLFYDLKRVFTEFDLVSAVEGNVDAWHEICRKIRLFYDLGCEKGKMGELIGRGQSVILNYPEEVLVEKFEFFCRLNTTRKEDVGLLILRYPEILDFDLENPVISVLGFLKHLGLSEEELNSISLNYPFVLGKNRLRNLPHLMRVLDLHEWFFNKIMNGDYRLLANFGIGSPNEEMENDFRDFLKTIRSTKNHNHTMGKLEFLYGIGFGENNATIKALSYLHGTRNELQERFDCLLHTGMEFSKLTRLVSMWPKILNQNVDNLEQKVNYLCNEMGCTLQYLDVFPGYLCFDLENRIKPRYKMHLWLTEKGLIKRHYSIASIFATSEKKFIARLFTIHPAVPKQWLEHFSSQRDSHSLQETEV